MDKIKFGTDGWRGIIAKDFTLANVAKVAYAVARYLTGKYTVPTAVIGYDCRFGGEMFMEAFAKILASKNIRVYISENIVSTPMVSLGVVKLKAQCGIMVTASHNSADYNGIKIKGEHGGPMLEKEVKDIENLISSDYEFDLEMLNWNYFIEQGFIQHINLESIYLKNIYDNFDVDSIRNSGIRIAFDAMYGSAQNIFKKLLPATKLFRCEVNPSFMGIPPDPVHKNLHQMEDYICRNQDIDFALAVDGDGDRIALFDEKGNFIDSHHIFLLLIYYLVEYKKLTGKVVVGFSVTSKVEYLCMHYGLTVIRTAIGFKEISRIMLQENILAGGEESGGMTTGTYLPERDGIWIGLTILNWMVESKKKLSELIDEVNAITGTFAYERMDVEFNKNIRNKILEHCKDNFYTEFGEYPISKIESLDGYKYHLGNDQWVMIRASGTEPVLRIYAEAQDKEKVSSIIKSVMNTLNNLK
jgi:phosphomannomutase